MPTPRGDAAPPVPPVAGPGTAAEARVLARSPRQCLVHGALHSLPFLLVLVPFGLLFGLVASEAGLDLVQAMGFVLLVLAGASQFTAIQLLSDHAPALIVIASALAVNLRMAMYSAALVPWIGNARPGQRALIAYLLIDQTFALSIAHYEAHPRLRLDQRLAYFWGTVLGSCPVYILSCGAGHVLGRAIPKGLALDFAVPITFLAMVAPMLRTPAHQAAALVAILGALGFAGLPSGLGILVTAPLAMATGAWVEARCERLRARRLA